MNDRTWANRDFQFVLSGEHRLLFRQIGMGTKDELKQNTQYSAHMPFRHSRKHIDTKTGSSMKIQLIVSRSILCVLSVASASCALGGRDRAEGHAGVEFSRIDRLDPITMPSRDQRSLPREASAGPTILFDEHGPRVVFVTERPDRMDHAEESGFIAASRRSLRSASAESAYLKLSLED